jgi:hypothetical protein
LLQSMLLGSISLLMSRLFAAYRSIRFVAL